MKFPRKSILAVIGAHPDDIEVGMGGTIARIAGNSVIYPIIAVIPNNKRKRMLEARDSCRFLNTKKPIFLQLNPEELEDNRLVITKIDKIFSSISPTHVFTHWAWDSHQDHRCLTRAVISACRKNQNSLLMYESMIPGGITPETFKPDVFVNITQQLGTKLKAIECHKAQFQKYGNSWKSAIKTRAMYRGNQVNVKYAECFEVVKLIIK